MEFGKKIKFGFNAVVGGQKASVINADPQLIANSTLGKFTITSPVSKALGIAAGENVQFINNIALVEKAVSEKGEDIQNIAAEMGIDISTREGELQLVDALTQWGIIKGRPEFDSKGNPIMVSPRFTEDDKRAYIAEHSAEILEANRDMLIERVGDENATDEELIGAIDLDEVEYPKVQSITGSKTATTSAATGVGLQLGFTDTSVWKTLKKDLGDDATKKNRIFDVALDSPVKTEVDGQEMNVYLIEFKEDTDPVVRGKKENEE